MVDTTTMPNSGLIMNDGQAAALERIVSAEKPGSFFLLTGSAGTGKTYLLNEYASGAKVRKKKIVLTATTHKAVSVIARKLKEAKLEDIPCVTIHALLSLKAKPQGDKLVFERPKWADPVEADIVVIDEASMVSEDLYRHIKRHLPNAFVLFVGDQAQLPPVGEVESKVFTTKDNAHLTAIVRQAQGNPILGAANTIRISQGSNADWSWCMQSRLEDGTGIFMPGEHTRGWLRKAFTSEEFEQDPDSFRYLAWTNARVHRVNEIIRSWRYGDDIPTPFMPGERAMFRSPLFVGDTMIFSTNEEAAVLSIRAGRFTHDIPKVHGSDGWTASINAWEIVLKKSESEQHTVHMPADEREFVRVETRIKDEAAASRIRWKHLHDFKQSMARMQSIYALTTHTSQGSTFGSVFLDLPDIRKRFASNLLEAQQLCYVAATRPSKRLVIVGDWHSAPHAAQPAAVRSAR